MDVILGPAPSGRSSPSSVGYGRYPEATFSWFPPVAMDSGFASKARAPE
jgi:hypothetical protein